MAAIILKFEQWIYCRIMCPKISRNDIYSADPSQPAPPKVLIFGSWEWIFGDNLYLKGDKIFSQQYLALNLSYYVQQKLLKLVDNDFMPKINFEQRFCIGKGVNPCSWTFNSGNIVYLNQKFWSQVSL